MEACIGQEIAPPEVLQEELRNGIILAKLAKFINPSSAKKIYMVGTPLFFSKILYSENSLTAPTNLEYKPSVIPALGQHQLFL